MTTLIHSSSRTAPTIRPRVRSIANLLAPLEQLAAHSANLVASREAYFESRGERYDLAHYMFIGPRGGDAPIRLGIFAAIHGDEPEGAYALVRFIEFLEKYPEIAQGYLLSILPVCNPTGFEDNTRVSRNGKDLSREFWKNSSEPEVRLLQSELLTRAFNGLISLRTDATSEGFYGVVRGATLTKHLIGPALAAAEQFLPRDERVNIDGFAARHGVVRDDREGVLSAPPGVRSRPFEIILAAPKAPPAYLKECAFVAALQTILTEYRKLIAYAPNL